MNPQEVPVMPAIEIPDPLPPAIALPREVIEFAISQHLADFGEHSLVARTWHWILNGGGAGANQSDGLVTVRRPGPSIGGQPGG
jgi:hypothetical protein